MSSEEEEIHYSRKYNDDVYEYRHVHVPMKLAEKFPNRVMTEKEWRGFGIQQSPGWVHYMIHGPERHVLLFRRPLPKEVPENNAGSTNNAEEETSKNNAEKDAEKDASESNAGSEAPTFLRNRFRYL
uniref:Cyclin-dependent kinases regulatory subunit n=1 Tax=Steinernema glaseri TaxID=37863 RepID=A0A1I7ZDM4_9BILA